MNGASGKTEAEGSVPGRGTAEAGGFQQKAPGFGTRGGVGFLHGAGRCCRGDARGAASPGAVAADQGALEPVPYPAQGDHPCLSPVLGCRKPPLCPDFHPTQCFPHALGTPQTWEFGQLSSCPAWDTPAVPCGRGQQGDRGTRGRDKPFPNPPQAGYALPCLSFPSPLHPHRRVRTEPAARRPCQALFLAWREVKTFLCLAISFSLLTPASWKPVNPPV